jgi:hypothetical protein
MSFSYDDIPDSKDVIQEKKKGIDRKVRMAFWQDHENKTHKQKTSGGELTCTKCILKHDSSYNYDNAVGYIQVGYDRELKSIIKKCDRCNDTQVLESGIEEALEEEREDSISPGGNEKVYPLFAAELNVGGNRDREGNRMPAGLSSNRALDENTIHDISSAFGSSPSSDGPTLTERLNWGRKKFIS